MGDRKRQGLTDHSVYDLRLLRMGAHPLRRRLRRSHGARLPDLRAGHTGRGRRKQGVCAMASEMSVRGQHCIYGTYTYNEIMILMILFL
jgi:hypothetical protein